MKYHQTKLTFQHIFGQTSAILTEPKEDATGIIILCHGFLSSKDSRTNVQLTKLLVQKGLSTLCFDWFGMGESSGQFSDITITTCQSQLDSLLKDMKTKGYRDIGLIGSSFGGLLSILVAANHPELFAIGLKCPVPDFPEMLELEFGTDGLSQWQQTNTIPNVTGESEPIALNFQFYENCKKFNAYRQAKQITTPCLIVHGQQDELVPMHQINQLEERLAGEKNLLLLKKANHYFGRPEDFQKMSLALTEWIVDHVPNPLNASRATA